MTGLAKFGMRVLSTLLASFINFVKRMGTIGESRSEVGSAGLLFPLAFGDGRKNPFIDLGRPYIDTAAERLRLNGQARPLEAVTAGVDRIGRRKLGSSFLSVVFSVIFITKVTRIHRVGSIGSPH